MVTYIVNCSWSQLHVHCDTYLPFIPGVWCIRQLQVFLIFVVDWTELLSLKNGKKITNKLGPGL